MTQTPTILDDREIVELLHLHPGLLAIADSVCATQRRKARSWASSRRVVVAAAATLAAAAVGTYLLVGSPAHTPGVLSQVQIPIPVADAAAADALLPFSVVLPSNATPISLTVSEQAQALYGHFSSSTDVSYVLDEELSSVTLAELQQGDQHVHPTATHTSVVVNGVPVLIQAWPDGSIEAQWFRGDGEGRVLSWIQGPDTSQGQTGAQTFTQQQALAVVADIISHGG